MHLKVFVPNNTLMVTIGPRGLKRRVRYPVKVGGIDGVLELTNELGFYVSGYSDNGRRVKHVLQTGDNIKIEYGCHLKRFTVKL